MARFHQGNARLAAPKGAIWVGLIGLALTTVIGFVAVSLSDWTKSTFAFDVWLHELGNPFAQHVAAVLEELDRPVVVAAILLLIGLVLSLTRGWLPALGFMVVAGVGWVLIAVVKELVREPRPTPFDLEFAGTSPSYPSGHTVFAVTLTVALWAVLKGSKWRTPLVILGSILVLVTAWSRLFLGVHYPLDVIGGILGGLSSAIFVIGAWNFVFARRKH